MAVQSRVPTIPDVVPNNWESVMRFSRDVRKYLNSLAKSDQTVSYSTITLSDLTASRLVSTDSSSTLETTALASWLTGTANQITVADDGDGTATLSTPQDLDTDADFEIGSLTIKDGDDNITFYADDNEFYVTASAIPISAGMPMGLLLTLTYASP